MQIRMFKTLWGFQGTLEQAISDALDDGYDGIEAQPPLAPEEAERWRQQLNKAGLLYQAEICTTGSYVADRRATLAEHLADFEAGARAARIAGARAISCLGGCDAWPADRSAHFFTEAMAMADKQGLAVSFETHRGRTLFNPWITVEMLRRLPDLRLTADLSHWCVVTERLLDTEQEELAAVIPRVDHIHARVGYDQGPQVPHPGAPEYQPALDAHGRWWQSMWAQQHQRGAVITTMTPEFGPDGYLQAQPFSGEPVGDLRELNRWIAEHQRAAFSRWHQGARG
jgi:sugar phosphate isomerase/epimerase